jgi:hypothetical protein
MSYIIISSVSLAVTPYQVWDSAYQLDGLKPNVGELCAQPCCRYAMSAASAQC